MTVVEVNNIAKKVTEGYKGTLSANGNRTSSVMVYSVLNCKRYISSRYESRS